MKIDLNQHFSAEEIEFYEKMMNLCASGEKANFLLAFQMAQGTNNRLFIENYYNCLSVDYCNIYRERDTISNQEIELALKRYWQSGSRYFYSIDNHSVKVATDPHPLKCPLDFRFITNCHRFAVATHYLSEVAHDELSTILYPVGRNDYGYTLSMALMMKEFNCCNAKTIQQVLENNAYNGYAKHVSIYNRIGSMHYQDVYSSIQLHNTNIETLHFREPIDISIAHNGFFENVTLPKTLKEITFVGFIDNLHVSFDLNSNLRANKCFDVISEKIANILGSVSSEIKIYIGSHCLPNYNRSVISKSMIYNTLKEKTKIP